MEYSILDESVISAKLCEHQEVVVYLNSIVSECHSCSYAANKINEDTRAQGICPDGTAMVGIFDGHSGATIAKFLESDLLSYVHAALSKTPQSDIPQALKKAFFNADQIFMETCVMDHTLHNRTMWDIFQGACAGIVVFPPPVDSVQRMIVAHAGDCRVLLVYRDKDQDSPSLRVVQLTKDHTLDTLEEREKLLREHPREHHNLIMHGRLKGVLEPTRCFGDWMFKSEHFYKLLHQWTYFSLPEPVQMPYVTVEPDVLIREMQPQDEFLVIASDGLYDILSNQEIAQLVEQYLRAASTLQSSGSAWTKSSVGNAQENVATFLIRKALARTIRNKSEQEALSYLIQIPPELRRLVHDDITVTVILLNTRANFTPRSVDQSSSNTQQPVESQVHQPSLIAPIPNSYVSFVEKRAAFDRHTSQNQKNLKERLGIKHEG